MYKCTECGKEYKNRYRFLGHCSSHKRGERFRRLRQTKKPKQKKNGKHECKYCGKEFDRGVQLGGHMGWCEKRPNGKQLRRSKIETLRRLGTGRKLSEESKKKISKFRIKFLKENPDMVPYRLNHSSKKSYPEKIFENALIANNVEGWEYDYQHGIYSYDFGFPKLKIDVEVDGKTHLTETVQKIDKIRDEFSESKGWQVLRFTAKEVKNDIDGCIGALKKMIKERT